MGARVLGSYSIATYELELSPTNSRVDSQWPVHEEYTAPIRHMEDHHVRRGTVLRATIPAKTLRQVEVPFVEPGFDSGCELAFVAEGLHGVQVTDDTSVDAVC